MKNKIQIVIGVILFCITVTVIPYINNNFVLESYNYTFLAFIYLWGLSFSFVLIVDGIRVGVNGEVPI